MPYYRNNSKYLSIKLLFLKSVFGLVLLTGFAQAQNINSPYSAIGLGEFKFKGFSQNMGMGGCGLTLQSPSMVNYMNPASQASLSMTNLHAGLTGLAINQVTPDSSAKEINASFSYLTLGFSVTKKNWWGMAIGLLPYTNIGYNFSDTITQLGQSIASDYSGTGGINKVFWSNGINPFRIINDSLNKDFAIGLNVDYYFGSVQHALVAEYLQNDSNSYLSFKTENRYNLSGYAFKIGLIQPIKIKNKHKLVLGATAGFGGSVKLSSSLIAQRFYGSNTSSTLIDTAVNVQKTDVKTKMPFILEGGISYQFAKKINFCVEYRSEYWSKLDVNNTVLNQYSNASSIHAGFQYNPSGESSQNFLYHTNYRAGFKSSVLPNYVKLANEQLKETALTLGLGIPLRGTFSTVNIGFEAGIRGTGNSNLVKQKYILLNLGLSINDKWFITGKYN